MQILFRSFIYYLYVLIWTQRLPVIITVFLPILEAAECNVSGKFGWECHFNCNCKDEELCDPRTGFCENGCKAGFYGPTCQFGKFGVGPFQIYLDLLVHLGQNIGLHTLISQYPPNVHKRKSLKQRREYIRNEICRTCTCWRQIPPLVQIIDETLHWTFMYIFFDGHQLY